MNTYFINASCRNNIIIKNISNITSCIINLCVSDKIFINIYFNILLY